MTEDTKKLCMIVGCEAEIWKGRPFCESHWKGTRRSLQSAIQKWWGIKQIEPNSKAINQAYALSVMNAIQEQQRQ